MVFDVHPTGFPEAALESSSKDVMTAVLRSKWASATSIASGVAMAALPKCPACVAAYLGFLSAFGIDHWAPDYLWPLTYSLFVASLAFLGYRAWREAVYSPFVVALAGAGILFAARMLDASPPVLWIGCGLFLAGVIWSMRQTPDADAVPCHATETKGQWS